MKKSNLTIRVAIAATFFTLSYVSIADAQTSPDTNKNQTDTDKTGRCRTLEESTKS